MGWIDEIYNEQGQKITVAALRARMGNIDVRPGIANADGTVIRLVRIDLLDGPAVVNVRMLGEDGTPLVGWLVAQHHPGSAQDITAGVFRRKWYSYVDAQLTNNEGNSGFGFSGGAFTHLPEGGPLHYWVLTPAAGVSSFDCDCLDNVGWQQGTAHIVPNPVFQVAREGGTAPPPVVPPADGSTVRGLLTAVQLQIDDANRTLAKALALLG